ncbi:MAG: hypothetical protein P8O76_03700 [Methylophilaceae bacterium]|nr:hypothetical protein [Methylophilaceae bacterium]
MQKAESMRSITIAGGAFAIFMGLTLLLIFAKIEFNLRGIRLASSPE